MENCTEKINQFCFICGKFTIPEQRKNISLFGETLYSLYFGKTVYRNVSWAPNKACKVCINALIAWFREKREKMPFRVPVVWSDPGLHDSENCYVCANDVFGLNRRTRHSFIYNSVPSGIRPVELEEGEAGPRRPSPGMLSEMTYEIESSQQTAGNDDEYEYPGESSTQGTVSQQWMDKVVRKLNLSQSGAETLAKELKNASVLGKDVKITSYRGRQKEFLNFFTASQDNTHAFCKDIPGVMKEKNIVYNPAEWRLFIDSSKSALKAVLLYYDNTKKSVPVFYGIGMSESYDSMKQILNSIKYNEHKWRLCCDLKVVAFLTGLQKGYTKHCCFLCLWDSRYKGNNYARLEWPTRTTRTAGESNVVAEPLVPVDKILMPPLHVKLGIVTNFIKALDKDGPAFEHLGTLFPRLSEAKIKQGSLNYE